MKKILPIIFLTLFFSVSFLVTIPITNAATTDPGVTTIEGELKINKPILEINIPKLDFSNAAQNVDSEGYLHLPWVGEYISAIYQFAMVVASILAVIVIILSGARMIVSAGGEEKNAATKRLGQALVGLVICWGSYAILYNINPALVEFQALKVKYVVPIPFDHYDPGEPAVISSPKPPTFTGFDTLFQSYANCLAADWRLLKAEAYIESAFSYSVKNSLGFTGLFQTNKKFCEGSLGIKGKTTYARYDLGKYCVDLTNPEVSTMVGTSMMKDSLYQINSKCRSIDSDSLIYFTYVGHQGGQGTLAYVLSKTCDYKNAYEPFHEFWEKVDKGIYADSTGKKRTAKDIAHEGDNGGKRMIGLVKSMGTTNAIASENKTKCPLTNISLIFQTTSNLVGTNGLLTGSRYKVLSVGDSITANPKSYADLMGVTKKIARVGERTEWMLTQLNREDLRNYTHVIILGGVNNLADPNATAAQIEASLSTMYNKAKTNGLKVVVITISPWKPYASSWTAAKQNTTDAVNNWIRSGAGGGADYVIDFNSLVRDSSDPQKLKQEYDSGDHLHPSNTAHQILANEIMSKVFPDVTK